MPLKSTNEISADRLRKELRALGMDSQGSRSELVNTLMQAGVYEINDSIKALPEKFQRTNNLKHHASILIGNGATVESEYDEKLVICNSTAKSPLVVGDFKDKNIQIDNCLKLKESVVGPEISGTEGDIRRSGSQLYMYRSTGVLEGWYPMEFGSIVLL